jgi:ketosteroid isomerase-like protein
MITRITRHQYLKGLAALERGDLDSLLEQFDPSCVFHFVGDSPLGAHLSTPDDLRRWFERFRRLLPNPRFEIQRFVVSGPPWHQHLAAHVLIASTINGEPYQNQFAHFLTLRWAKVIDDLVVEDTQMWERACKRLVDAGMSEAAQGPLLAEGS